MWINLHGILPNLFLQVLGSNGNKDTYIPHLLHEQM